VGEADAEIAASGPVAAELALAVRLGDTRLGDVEAPRPLALDDAELAAVTRLDARRPAAVARIDALLVEGRRLLDVRIRRDAPIGRHAGPSVRHPRSPDRPPSSSSMKRSSAPRP